jgi:hypothetical protein
LKDFQRSTTDAPLQPDVSEFADDQNEHNSSVQDRAKVESLRETGSNLESPATSSNGGDSLVVRQILQDILELGRLPKEFKKPNTDGDVAEHKLAMRMRRHNLRSRAEQELQTRFFKRHLKAF